MAKEMKHFFNYVRWAASWFEQLKSGGRFSSWVKAACFYAKVVCRVNAWEGYFAPEGEKKILRKYGPRITRDKNRDFYPCNPRPVFA